MTEARRLVVIGGGVAGVRAALGARAVDGDLSITLLCAEAVDPYDRTALSKDVLLKDVMPEDIPIVPQGELDAQRIEVIRGAHVQSIDTGARTVQTADGRHYAYDALILATGAEVRRLPTPGADECSVAYLRTREDALTLRSRLQEARRLVVIGAGLIGLEVAAAASEMGIEVNVLEMAPTILGRSCDAHTADAMARLHLNHGVTLHNNCRIDALRPIGAGGFHVVLGDATVLDADLVVAGIGVIPETALAERTGLRVEDGILVDAYGETSMPGIYAAGDATRLPLPFWPQPVRLETWRHAQDHGDAVGRNAAGEKLPYQAPPSFWSDQYGHRLQGVGMLGPDAGHVVVRTYEDGAHTSFLMNADGRLRAAIGIDKPQDINAARRLIAADVPLDGKLLADAAMPVVRILKQLKG
ncbi:MAG: FAD-dependent oxidoreductase [Aquisalimonadaceae bacterium]